MVVEYAESRFFCIPQVGVEIQKGGLMRILDRKNHMETWAWTVPEIMHVSMAVYIVDMKMIIIF